MPVAVAARPANTPPTPVESSEAKDTAAALPSARRNPLPQLQAGVDHAWQSAGVTLVRMRQQTQQRASALGHGQTQVASQRVRLGQLWQRLAWRTPRLARRTHPTCQRPTTDMLATALSPKREGEPELWRLSPRPFPIRRAHELRDR